MNFFTDENGATAVEYTVFMAAFSLAITGIYTAVYLSLGNTFSILTDAMTSV
jgi:Flp pilus assembly pilin Flp